MENQFREIYDKESIVKDISERKELIRVYQLTGRLDRNTAIEKIQKLRLTDADVAVATMARLAAGSAPYSQIPDQNIIAELQLQIDVLTAKLPKDQK